MFLLLSLQILEGQRHSRLQRVARLRSCIQTQSPGPGYWDFWARHTRAVSGGIFCTPRLHFSHCSSTSLACCATKSYITQLLPVCWNSTSEKWGSLLSPRMFFPMLCRMQPMFWLGSLGVNVIYTAKKVYVPYKFMCIMYISSLLSLKYLDTGD